MSKAAKFARRLSARVVSLREERGYTQKHLAALARINPGYLSSIESGQRVPSVAVLIKLAEALRVSVSDVIDPATPPPKTLDATALPVAAQLVPAAALSLDEVLPGLRRAVSESAREVQHAKEAERQRHLARMRTLRERSGRVDGPRVAVYVPTKSLLEEVKGIADLYTYWFYPYEALNRKTGNGDG